MERVGVHVGSCAGERNAWSIPLELLGESPNLDGHVRERVSEPVGESVGEQVGERVSERITVRCSTGRVAGRVA